MKVYLGSDHGGFELKEKVKEWLGKWGYKFEDCGPKKFDPEDDYPDFAIAVARKVVGWAQERSESIHTDARDTDNAKAKVNNKYSLGENLRKGILLCRSAAGMVIAANKIAGIRAAAGFDKEGVKHMREHNNANVLVLGADWLDEKRAKVIIRTFLETEFSGEERHVRRLKKIIEIECYK